MKKKGALVSLTKHEVLPVFSRTSGRFRAHRNDKTKSVHPAVGNQERHSIPAPSLSPPTQPPLPSQLMPLATPVPVRHRDMLLGSINLFVSLLAIFQTVRDKTCAKSSSCPVSLSHLYTPGEKGSSIRDTLAVAPAEILTDSWSV